MNIRISQLDEFNVSAKYHDNTVFARKLPALSNPSDWCPNYSVASCLLWWTQAAMNRWTPNYYF